MEKVIRSIKSQFFNEYDFIPVVIKRYVIAFSYQWRAVRHESDVLHYQIFRDCMTNFCAMRHILIDGTD